MSARAIKAITLQKESVEKRLLEGGFRDLVEARELVAKRKAFLIALNELGAGTGAPDSPEDDD